MSNSAIQSEIRSLQETIRNAQNRINELRKWCKHENVFIGNFEFQRPTIMQCTICADCCHPVDNSKVEKWKEENDKQTYLHKLGE